MLNQSALEALYSATYVEDYLDSMENLPDDIQRQLTRMREMDLAYQTYLKELESSMNYLLDEKEGEGGSGDVKAKKKIYRRLQQLLISAQDVGDEKLQIVQQVQDFVDNKSRQLELDKKNLDFGKEHETHEVTREAKTNEATERNIKRARRARHEVFVPSILGPSTLEATSYSEASSTSHHESHLHHHHHQHSGRGSHHASHSATSSVSATASTSVSAATVASSSVNSAAVTVTHSASTSTANSHGAASAGTSASAAGSTVASHSDKSNSAVSGSSGSNASSATPVSTVAATPKKQTQKQQNQDKKYKKRKSNKQSDHSPPNIPIDPDEPTYCLCDQVSYGEMIGCDNDLCPIEWFHFSCVSLTTKPKGKWYCPKCRGDRPNIMKPKAIFLKELEKYNREKEEKA